MNYYVAAPRSLALFSYLRFVTFQIKRCLGPFIGGLLLMCVGNAYAEITVGLEILNNIDSNGNITVVNGSKVKVAYAVTEDTDKKLNKADKIQLVRVKGDKVISEVARGKKKSGTVSLVVRKSQDEQLYVRYVRKGKNLKVIATVSKPTDPEFTPLVSIPNLSNADLAIRLNAMEMGAPKANVASTAPSANDDIDSGYPDGSVWIDMSQNQAYILVDGTAGAAVWKHVTDHAETYAIGDTGPAGGIVFYITDGGAHGLEAAASDLTTAEWGCFTDNITGADGTAIGTGAQNTADILAGCDTAGIAAQLADAYSLNGYNDWFLPSKDALDELYENNAVVGGFASNIYWSSSEFNNLNAWYQVFTDGFQANGNKDAAAGGRAVRAF